MRSWGACLFKRLCHPSASLLVRTGLLKVVHDAGGRLVLETQVCTAASLEFSQRKGWWDILPWVRGRQERCGYQGGWGAPSALWGRLSLEAGGCRRCVVQLPSLSGKLPEPSGTSSHEWRWQADSCGGRSTQPSRSRQQPRWLLVPKAEVAGWRRRLPRSPFSFSLSSGWNKGGLVWRSRLTWYNCGC